MSDKTIHSITNHFHPEFFVKNKVIINAGEKCNKLYFIVEGLVRTYHITDSGTEFTRLIAAENQFVTILNSFQDNEPSEATIETLEEYQKFQLQRIELLTRYSPSERIKIFRKTNKNLLPRLTNKIIASYLNMTPETYSRSLKKLLV